MADPTPDTPLVDVLSGTVAFALTASGAVTLADAAKASEVELRRLPGVGAKGLQDAAAGLARAGLAFVPWRPSLDRWSCCGYTARREFVQPWGHTYQCTYCRRIVRPLAPAPEPGLGGETRDRRTHLLEYLRRAQADGVWSPTQGHPGMVPWGLLLLVHTDLRALIDEEGRHG